MVSQPTGSPAPRALKRGGPGYHRALLYVIAKECYQDFTDAAEELRQACDETWRVSLDLCTEILVTLSRHHTTAHRDPLTGAIRIDTVFRYQTEEDKLRWATQVHESEAGDLAPHELFARRMASGEVITGLYQQWHVLLQEAADLLQRTGGDPAVVRPVLLRPLEPEDRDSQLSLLGVFLHSGMRPLLWPDGDAWVADRQRSSPRDLDAQLAARNPEDWYGNHLPDWFLDDVLERGRQRLQTRRGRRRRSPRGARRRAR